MSIYQVITSISQSTGFPTDITNLVYDYLYSYQVYECNEEFREFKICYYLPTGFRWTNFHLNPIFFIHELITDTIDEESIEERKKYVVSIIRYVLYNQELIIKIYGESGLVRIKKMISDFLIYNIYSWEMSEYYYIQINFIQ